MRVLFLLSEYSLHNHIVLDYLVARPADEAAILKVPMVVKGKSRLESAQRILPKASKRFIAAKTWEFFVVFAITVLPKILRRGAVFYRLRRIARMLRLPYMVTDNVMSADSLEFIRDFAPDVIVSLFHQILRKELLEIPAKGTVNLHPGLLPQFKGIQPYFWSLACGNERSGATIHFIDDEQIDTGRILAQASYRNRPGMSVQLNYFLTVGCLARLLPRCIELIEQGNDGAVDQAEFGAGEYFGWPDAAAVDLLERRGHRIFALRDLIRILIGSYDNFAADDFRFYEKTGGGNGR